MEWTVQQRGFTSCTVKISNGDWWIFMKWVRRLLVHKSWPITFRFTENLSICIIPESTGYMSLYSILFHRQGTSWYVDPWPLLKVYLVPLRYIKHNNHYCVYICFTFLFIFGKKWGYLSSWTILINNAKNLI